MEAPIDVLGRASSVLRTVSSAEPDGLTTSEVSMRTGLARPTAHRLLTSLHREGLLDREHTSGRWMLGPELYLFGAAAAFRYDVTAVAQPFVRRLAQVTGESAFFSARRGDETICLLREDGSFPIRSHVLHEGIRFPLGVGSAGLAILAHLPDTEIDAFLERSQPDTAHGTVHTAAAIQARVIETRRTGYAVNPGLIVTGSWGMGAAVFNGENQPAYALSLTGIEHRFAEDRRVELGELLLRAAHQLTQALGRPGTGRPSGRPTNARA